MDDLGAPWGGGRFVTPEGCAREVARRTASGRGELLLASCRSGDELARGVACAYRETLRDRGSEADVVLLSAVDTQFSDTETCARLERDVHGADVYLFQALRDPCSTRSVDENVMALLVAARTFREWGAAHVTGVLPYLAYGRQDKPTRFRREPTTARLLLDLVQAAGVDRVVTWHPHSAQVHGFAGSLALTVLEPLGLFVEEFREYDGRDDVVVVAPDRGAAELAGDVGQALNLDVAYAAKQRPLPEHALITGLAGSLEGKRLAIVLDDILSTGGTLEALVRLLVDEHGVEEVHVAISHNLGMDRALRTLQALHADGSLRRFVTTDSVPQPVAFRELPFASVRSLRGILAGVVNAIHYGAGVEFFFSRAP